MIREFFKNTSIYSMSGILVTIISIFLIPFYTRVFTPSDYGIIDLMAIISNLVAFTIALEISQGLGRFTLDADDKKDKVEYASTALIFTIITYSIFFFISFVNADLFSEMLFKSQSEATIFIVAVSAMWVNGIFSLLNLQLVYLKKPLNYAITNISFNLISVILTVIFVLIMKIGIIGVFYGQLCAGLMCLSISFYYTRGSFALAIERKKLLEMLRFSIPLIPSSVGVFISLFIDRLAINQLMSLSDLGIYGIGLRVASMINLFICGTQMAINPLIYSHYKEKDTPDALVKIFRFFLVPSLLALIGASIFSRELLIIFTTSSYYGASQVIPVLIFALFFAGTYVFFPGLILAKKTRNIALINISGAILNTFLVYNLIPLYGIYGAAISTLSSALVLFSVNAWISQKNYFIPYPWKIIGYSFAIAVITILISNIFNVVSLPSIIFKLLIWSTSGILIARLLLTNDELKEIYSEIQRSISK